MTSTNLDPFDEGVPRDGYGRPKIIPIGRGGKPNTKSKPVAYTRASTFAKALDDAGGLATWKVRHGVVGVACNPDLAAMIAALGPNPDDYTPQQKRDLDAIIDTAHDRSGGNAKANYGTAIHSLTEPGSPGIPLGAMDRDAAAYTAALDAAGLDPVTTEQFVVNDELTVAGTYDHVYAAARDIDFEYGGKPVTIPAGTRLLGDKKTGRLSFESFVIQLATYARARGYDHVTGDREPLEVSPQWGILAHIPAGQATADLYIVDLHTGWEAARQAKWVREFRSRASKLGVKIASGSADPAPAPAAEFPAVDLAQIIAAVQADVDTLAAVTAPNPHLNPAAPDTIEDAVAADEAAGLQPVDAILHQIHQAPDAPACRTLWSDNRNAWTDVHTAAVKQRLTELQTAA